MPTTAKITTAEQLAAMPDDGNRYELVLGNLRMMSPAGNQHGRIAMNLGVLLANHVRENHLGVVYAAETGFLLTRDPDTVRAPGVAFVCQHRLHKCGDLSVTSGLPAFPTAG